MPTYEGVNLPCLINHYAYEDVWYSADTLPRIRTATLCCRRLVSFQRWLFCCRGRDPISIGWEAGWVPEVVWTEMYLFLHGILLLAHTLVTVRSQPVCHSSQHRPGRLWCSPSLIWKWYRNYFLGLKWPVRDVDHSLTSSAKVKNRWSYISASWREQGLHHLFWPVYEYKIQNGGWWILWYRLIIFV